MNLTERVEGLCKEKGISVFALEIETGLSGGSIGKWKTCAPNIRGVQAVADYFGLTVDEVLKGVVIPEKPKAAKNAREDRAEAP